MVKRCRDTDRIEAFILKIQLFSIHDQELDLFLPNRILRCLDSFLVDIDAHNLCIALEIFHHHLNEMTFLCGNVKHFATSDTAYCSFDDVHYPGLLSAGRPNDAPQRWPKAEGRRSFACRRW